tara:strand:- start:28 stop:216 length:189 start_codon:yes stop_codon:yes gene_type:complete
MIVAKFECDTPDEMLNLLLDLEGELHAWSHKEIGEWDTKVYIMPYNIFLIVVILNKEQKWKQ